MPRRLLAGLAAATLALAACGSDGSSTEDAAPTASNDGPVAPAEAPSPDTGADGEAGTSDAGADEAPGDGPLTGTFATVDGGMIDLGDFAGQDVILWFWAPW